MMSLRFIHIVRISFMFGGGEFHSCLRFSNSTLSVHINFYLFIHPSIDEHFSNFFRLSLKFLFIFLKGLCVASHYWEYHYTLALITRLQTEWGPEVLLSRKTWTWQCRSSYKTPLSCENLAGSFLANSICLCYSRCMYWLSSSVHLIVGITYVYIR